MRWTENCFMIKYPFFLTSMKECVYMYKIHSLTVQWIHYKAYIYIYIDITWLKFYWSKSITDLVKKKFWLLDKNHTSSWSETNGMQWPVKQ